MTSVGSRRCEHCDSKTMQHRANFVNGSLRPANFCERCKTVTVFGENADRVVVAMTRYAPRACGPCGTKTFHAVLEQGTPAKTPRCVVCVPHADDAVELKDLSKF